ncbi:MAG: restriction endonuclease [Novosphingobium sp. 32-60-15]|uniref:BglII/BstYI family type II restriction endonuclease n=1 Tax=unclassified Novosphingobium TaxID=2644732 RepID=UPI000BD5B9EC|nr:MULTISPECIES: BglII/BstYI family type II restriction endonuclease [unclassified Novosphingobium]OYX61377.1 MAG: restriction endonuclease [Novosphingobium sp. 32-60-15]
MDPYSYFPAGFAHKYAILEWRHALAILKGEFPEQFLDLCHVLSAFELRESSITQGGGGKSLVSGFLDGELTKRGWAEKGFDTATVIDGVTYETPTHKVDCVKGRVALDIEWNNKTEFYDRDLNNFRMLHTLGAISVGIIVTRDSGLQTAVFNPLNIGSKYGASTTHLNKLIPKINGGGAGGCPLLVIAVKSGAFVAGK